MEPAPRTGRSAAALVVSTLVAVAILEALVWGAFALAGVEARGIRVAFAILAVPVGFVFGAVGHALVTGRAR